jgi:hypothetical protein
MHQSITQELVKWGVAARLRENEVDNRTMNGELILRQARWYYVVMIGT